MNGTPAGYTPQSGDARGQTVVIPDAAGTFAGPTLTVLRAAELDGRILDARGRPVPQARVVGLCRAGTCVRLGGPAVVADGKGFFRLEQGPDGRFPLGEATAWLARYREHWEESYQRLDSLLSVLQGPAQATSRTDESRRTRQ